MRRQISTSTPRTPHQKYIRRLKPSTSTPRTTVQYGIPRSQEASRRIRHMGNNSDTAAQSLATWPWRSAYSEVSPSAFLHSAFSGTSPAAEHGRSLCSTRGKDEAEDGGTHVGLASGREQDDPPTPDEAGHLGISAKDVKSHPHTQAQNSVPMASGSHEVKVNAVQSGGSSSSSSTWRGAKLPSPPPAPAPLTPIDDRAPVAAEHQQDQQAEH